MQPIMDPKFSVREAAKALILLEDHLFHPPRRCFDCIAKHAMAAEAFLEEAVTLGDDADLVAQIEEYPPMIRATLRDFIDGELTAHQAALSFRGIRKALVGISWGARFTENRLLGHLSRALTEARAEAALTVGDKVIVQSIASPSTSRWRGRLHSADLLGRTLFVKDRHGHLHAVDLDHYTARRHEDPIG